MNTSSTTDSSSNLLIESLVSQERQGGILCNDSSGLCVDAQGSLVDDAEHSGVYTNLVKLAQQLQQQPGESNYSSPLITVECDDMALLVKEYDGNTVTVKLSNTMIKSTSHKKSK